MRKLDGRQHTDGTEPERHGGQVRLRAGAHATLAAGQQRELHREAYRSCDIHSRLGGRKDREVRGVYSSIVIKTGGRSVERGGGGELNPEQTPTPTGISNELPLVISHFPGHHSVYMYMCYSCSEIP